MVGQTQPQLQVALDLASRDAALAVAMQVAPAVDRLEAGTPLLLSAGFLVISDLRTRFPETVIIADTKICDAGERIAESALESGADVVTIVAAVADVATWQGVRKAIQRKAAAARRPRLMADLIGCKDVVLAAQMAAELGADELCLHMPKRYSPETQALWERALTDVREARSSAAVPLYVAGGITPADVPLLLDSGADGLIVGGAITGAPDPAQASHQFCSHACRG